MSSNVIVHSEQTANQYYRGKYAASGPIVAAPAPNAPPPSQAQSDSYLRGKYAPKG